MALIPGWALGLLNPANPKSEDHLQLNTLPGPLTLNPACTP